MGSEETRRLILDSAERLFAEHGYATTTLKMIAEDAGLTQGSVYHHYRTKSELFLKVDSSANDRMLVPMQEAAAAERTFSAQLSAVLDVATEIVRTDPVTHHFVVMVRLEARRHAEIAEAGHDTRWGDLWQLLISTGIQTGEIDASDRQWALGMLMAVFSGLGQISAELDFERFRLTVEGFKRAFPHSFHTPRRRVAIHNEVSTGAPRRMPR
ncbi:TetR/AcrR family transcriptional regulator [Mycobacterium vicinigordonae]|uniref:TetR/AcrR family transcriptional regulator n=1 Tax=Mycobacterium vicinigordonae TaxID=1719132 RepID=A0A7D6E3B7_9MYCO|nr:TetR/AcrR family transcriptional regulator [Mycobacterium vicinigordonae]QLL08701.1 TetR/AcrR family transcriptional regulator [Mycobacterium vicinigordonae]